IAVEADPHLARLLARGPDHQLHHAAGPGMADGIGIERAFLAADAVRQRPDVGRDRGQRRIALTNVEHRAFDAPHSRYPHWQALAAELLPELHSEAALGIIVERFRERSHEQRLLGGLALLTEHP